ncbi:pheromone-regulated protein prm10 [Microbotryomycetes sp. JL221]|nr:pheromone-regulated protein prm10 [Microbotryomycetes sp. JL221]
MSSGPPSRGENPFDRPYDAAAGPASGAAAHTPPQLPIAGQTRQPQQQQQQHVVHQHDFTDNTHATVSTSSQPTSNSSPAATTAPTQAGNTSAPASGTQTPELRHKPSRHVQWGEQLSTHVSIPVSLQTSPSRSMQDRGAHSHLTQALEEHRRKESLELERKYIGQSASEGPSRAASSDGEPEARLEEMRENMDVFVDPNETDGLPTVTRGGVEAKAKKAAWGLVRQYTTGGMGFRQRKNASGRRASEAGYAADESSGKSNEDAKDDGDEKQGNTFSRSLKNPFDNRNDISTTDVPARRPSVAPGNLQGGGILAALIALQQQQQDGGSVSEPTTPGSMTPSRPSSIASSDDEDDEEERLKFLAKLHERRARGNFVTNTGSAVAGARRAAAGAVGSAGRGAGAALGLKPNKHSKSATDLASMDTSQPKSGTIGSWVHSRTATPGQEKRKTGLFDIGKFAVDDRPDAAKNGAGVFGGLVASTANLTGPAAPSPSSLGPAPDRPGFHLSRYSEPQVPTLKGNRNRTNTNESGQPGDLSGTTAGSSSAGSTVGNTPPHSPPLASGAQTPSEGRKKPGFMINLKDMHGVGSKFHSRPSSRDNSPSASKLHLADYFGSGKEMTDEERDRRDWEKEKRRRRKAREKKKAQEVFITMHVAAILERQQFIMKLARAFMMFGAPSHRLEAQMQATARVLELNCQVIYIPGVMLLSFGDSATHTSEVKFLKQANGLDLGKLRSTYQCYYQVIYDQISVTDASIELDRLMTAPPRYNLWQNMLIGACASAFIQPSAFYGSFIDCLMAAPLGALLVFVQVMVSRNDLYSSLFEIVIACINAFLAAALASTKRFCFAAVASGSVVLILPGYIVLCGSLELANRSIISGSVRLVYSILYSLFLGFGLAMGSEVYQRITGLSIYGADNNVVDYTCSALRGPGVPWYQATIPAWWYFLTIPCFLTCLALRNGQPIFRRETPIMICVGAAGFVGNYFSGRAFPGRSDIVSAIGSFVVGFLGNLYGKFTRGSPFIVMVAGVLLQLPSGLANGGLLRFAAESSDGSGSSSSYAAGFQTAQSLVEVAIGLTVGLFVSAALVNVLGGGRRRGTNLSSF